MPATAYELFSGRTQTIYGSKLGCEIEYIVRGAADEDEVTSAAISSVPTSTVINGTTVPRTSIAITERLNASTWKVKATFAQTDPSSPDSITLENSYSFDTGGGSQHITQSRETKSSTGPQAADLGGAINFDGENVGGVDIVVPSYTWSETYWFSDAYVTTLYKTTLAALTGSINAGTFRGFPAGDVLFMGASGTKQGNGWWQITFKFSYSPTMINIAVGAITVPSKRGWDYLWVRYGDDVDATAKIRIKKPVAAYVERVYPEGNFSGIGIGT